VLSPDGKVQAFCNRNGGVTNRNGGLASVIAMKPKSKRVAKKVLAVKVETSPTKIKKVAAQKQANKQSVQKDQALFFQATMASRQGDYLLAKKLFKEIIDKSNNAFYIRTAKNQLKVIDIKANKNNAVQVAVKQQNKKNIPVKSQKQTAITSSVSVADMAMKAFKNQNRKAIVKTQMPIKVKNTSKVALVSSSLSESDIDKLLPELIKKSKNTVNAIKTNKKSYQEAKVVLTKHIIPSLNQINNFIIARFSYQPTDIKAFNSALLKLSQYKKATIKALNYWAELKDYYIGNNRVYVGESKRELDAIGRKIVKSVKKYRKYSNDVIDLYKFKKDVEKNAWNPLNVQQVLIDYFPILNEPDLDFERYPGKSELSLKIDYLELSFDIGKFLYETSSNSKHYYKRLPRDSKPRRYAKKTIQIIDKQDDVFNALHKLRKQKNYYINWNYESWPDSVLFALKRAHERRRIKFKGLNALPAVSELSSDKIKFMGNLVIGETKVFDAVNGYMTAVEETYSRTNYVTSGPYKEKTPYFMGIFKDKLKMEVISYNELDKHISITCLIYDRAGYGKTEDCLFFKDKVLAGYSLNMSSENCKNKCERHNIVIDYFSEMGFKLVDETIEGKRIWREFILGDIKFNYKLWGEQRTYIKKKYINGVYAKQYAQVCVFDSSIESVLLKNESNGTLSCS